jgi:hypothetical protein
MDNDINLPDYYVDSFRFTVSPYGAAFTLGTSVPHPSPGKVAPGKDLLVLRMSLEQAKVLAMMLRRNLKNYEEENRLEIALPAQLFTQLGIAKEDWA